MFLKSIKYMGHLWSECEDLNYASKGLDESRYNLANLKPMNMMVLTMYSIRWSGLITRFKQFYINYMKQLATYSLITGIVARRYEV